MLIPKVRRVAHVVLYVRDPAASSRWYCEVLGMKVSAEVLEGPYQGGFFLSFGEHDHDLALFPATSTAKRGQEFEHIGLEVDCDGNLDQLRRLYGSMIRHNVRIHEILDHGVSIGVYFFDPDGHQLEVFCQLVPPAGGAAIAELTRNHGQANPITLEPLFE
jgi:catechol 2,3-dioxygenase-like lactoylglutathione lyase family enzyme